MKITSSLKKDTIREIRKGKSRFISITVLVALAVLFLFGLRMAAPDMEATADAFFDAQNMMDIRIISTLGITDEDVLVLAQCEGIEAAEGSYGVDAIAQAGDASMTVHTISISETMNCFDLIDGRMPQEADECIVETDVLDDLGLSVGDVITLDTGDGDYADALTETSFTIVGSARSPLYVSTSKGTSSLGSGKVDGVIGLLPQTYTLDYYTDLYLTVEGAAALLTYDDAYEALIGTVTDSLDEIADERAANRLEEVVSEAQAEVDDGWEEYYEAKAEADEELSDAAQELADAREELDDGWASYEDGLKEVSDAEAELSDAASELSDAKEQLSDALQTLEDGEASYEDGLAEYEEGLSEYQDGLSEYEEGLSEYESGYAQYEEGLAAYEASAAEYESGCAQYEEGLSEYESGYAQYEEGLAEYEAGCAQYEEGLAEYEAAAAQLEEMAAYLALGYVTQEEYDAAAAQLAASKAVLDETLQELTASKAVLDETVQELSAAKALLDETAQELSDAKVQLDAAKATLDETAQELAASKAQLDAAAQELSAAKAQLDAAAQELSEARQELDDGWAEYYDGLAEYEDGLAEYEEGKAELSDAEEELEDARITLEDGEAEYADGLAEYEEGKAEADEELSDARADLLEAQETVDEIDDCTWYVTDRSSNIGYVGYEQEAERMSNLALVFPLIFFLVAALVCLTTMTRMVEEQRVQIGCLKALGYSKGQIAFKYVVYGLAASVIGGIIGLIIGGILIPSVLMWAWSIMYDVPGRMLLFKPGIMITCVGAAALCCTIAVLSAVLSALRAAPASLMRPRAPKAGKRVWIEYIAPLWNRLNFSMKVSARNLFRYQKRFWMTVIGIMGCTALIVAGFGIRDSINAIVGKQFDEISLYDATVTLSEEPDASLLTLLAETNGIADYTGAYMGAVDFETDAYTISGYLMSVSSAQELDGYLDFHTRKGDEDVPLTDEGVIITEKTARVLEVQIGDTISVISDDEVYTVVISGICENYLYHYIYMTDAYYASVFGEEPQTDYLMIHYTDDADAADTMAQELLAHESVAAITKVSDNLTVLEEQLKAVDAVMVIIIGAAAALAFVVLFNLSNINITERSRELATLKVLGFRYPEMNAYVMRESFVLTIFGMLAGLLAGKYLHLWLMTSVEIEMAMFGREVLAMSYVYAVVLTIVFSLIANTLAGRKLRKIDMVESLKAVE